MAGAARGQSARQRVKKGVAPAPAAIRPTVLLGLAAFASMATMRAADPLIPQLAEEFGVGAGEAAIVASAYTLAYGLSQFLLGPVGDRLGKFVVVATMTTLAGVATALVALADDLVMLGVLRFLGGAAAGGIIPLAMAYIGDVVPPERVQSVLARFMSGSILGFVAGQVMGGVVGAYLGWRGLFLILASLFLGAGALLFVELRSGRVARGRAPAAVLSVWSFVALLRGRRVRLVVGSVFVEAFLVFGAFTYVGAFLRHSYGLGYAAIGLVLATYGAGSLLFTTSAPRAIALLGQGGLVVVGGSLMAMAFASLAAAPPLWLLPPVMCLCGLGFYMMHNTLQTQATQMAPQARGAAVSLFAATLLVGQSIGIELCGRLIAAFGYGAVFLGVAALLPLLGVFLRLKLRTR